MRFFRTAGIGVDAANLGAGLGWFKSKIGSLLQFKSVTATSNKISLANNVNDIGIDVNESNLDITTKDHVKTITFLDSPYLIASDDVLIGVDTTGGPVVLTLPTGVGTEGRRLYIKKLSSDANSVTINRSGGDTIEGATSHSYIEQYNECILRKINATTWIDESSVIEKRISNILGTGLLTGGRLTVNGGDAAKFDITAGVGFVVDNHTDPSNPVKTRIAWAAKIALPTTFLATKTASYVAIDINGNVIQQTTAFTAEQTRDLIILGKLVHPNFVSISSTNPVVQTSFDSLLQLLDFCRTIGPMNISGNEFSANGANLNLDKTAGTVFRIGSNYDVSTKNPSIFTSALMAAGSWTYYYRSAVPGEWTPISVISAIDPNYWDDGTGTLNDVTAGYWTIQTIYQYAGTNRTVVQYGQAEYPSLATALSERTTAFIVNPVLGEACFRCWLFVKQGATALNDVAQAQFITAGKFGLVNIVSSSIGGEINTASNQGTAGYGTFYTKSGVDLQFKNIAANSTKIALTDDVVGHNIKIDVDEANLSTVLKKASNLSDVASVLTSRINLNIDKRTPVVDADKIIASTDVYVALTSISAPRTFTLPAANSVNAGYEIEVADESGSVTSTNTITVQRAGADTLDGGTTVKIATPYAIKRFFSDGVSKWTVNLIIKEVFFLAETNVVFQATFRTRTVGTGGTFAFDFKVPFDFVSLIEITAQGFISAGALGAGKNIDLVSNYAGVGQVYNTNSQSDAASTYNLGAIANALQEYSLATVFSSLHAGDMCGVQITHNALGGAVDYVGIRLKYRAFI